MRANDISWDLTKPTEGFEFDYDFLDLPDDVNIPKEVEENDIADYLSDTYGFCVESFVLVKDFENLDSDELWEIRKQVVLDSCYVADFSNREGYKAEDMSHFFDGYVNFIYELMDEDGVDESAFCAYDNADNLERWFDCYDDLSWVRWEE